MFYQKKKHVSMFILLSLSPLYLWSADNGSPAIEKQRRNHYRDSARNVDDFIPRIVSQQPLREEKKASCEYRNEHDTKSKNSLCCPPPKVKKRNNHLPYPLISLCCSPPPAGPSNRTPTNQEQCCSCVCPVKKLDNNQPGCCPCASCLGTGSSWDDTWNWDIFSETLYGRSTHVSKRLTCQSRPYQLCCPCCVRPIEEGAASKENSCGCPEYKSVKGPAGYSLCQIFCIQYLGLCCD